MTRSLAELMKTRQTFDLKGEITPETIVWITSWLREVARSEDRTGVVYFYSGGGSIQAGIAIYGAIRAAQAGGIKLTAVATSSFHSIAVLIFLAFDERLVLPTIGSNIHSTRYKSVWPLDKGVPMEAFEVIEAERQADMANARRMNSQVSHFFVARCGWKNGQVEKRLAKTKWYFGEELVKVRIATGLLE